MNIKIWCLDKEKIRLGWESHYQKEGGGRGGGGLNHISLWEKFELNLNIPFYNFNLKKQKTKKILLNDVLKPANFPHHMIL